MRLSNNADTLEIMVHQGPYEIKYLQIGYEWQLNLVISSLLVRLGCSSLHRFALILSWNFKFEKKPN